MTIERIKKDAVYQQVLKDSCGGIMYNVAYRGKYDATNLLAMWDSLSPQEQNASGGIMKGAMGFLTEA